MKLRPLGSLRRRDPVQLAELPDLRSAALRTSGLRVLLALALAGTLAALIHAAGSAGSGRAAVFPQGTTTGVVALDMSASISGPVYARVASTLRGIVDANQSIGLVMFSDTAYSLLPPNSPPGALLQFIPFFTPVRYYGATPVFAQSPWDNFSGGTRIASGLTEARQALERAHIAHGAILVVSDLDDAAADQPALAAEAVQLQRDHIAVRDRAAVREPSEPPLLRSRLRRQRVRRPQRLHSHRETSRAVGCSRTAVGAARARPPARAASGRQRALEQPSLDRGHHVRHLRKHRAGLLAIVCVAAGIALVMLALDARDWRTTVAQDDLRFRALPAHTGLWKPQTSLPGDPASALLGTGDTMAYRRALQLFWYSRIGSNPESRQDLPTLRAEAQQRLQNLTDDGLERARAVLRREPARRPRRHDADVVAGQGRRRGDPQACGRLLPAGDPDRRRQ